MPSRQPATSFFNPVVRGIKRLGIRFEVVRDKRFVAGHVHERERQAADQQQSKHGDQQGHALLCGVSVNLD